MSDPLNDSLVSLETAVQGLGDHLDKALKDLKDGIASGNTAAQQAAAARVQAVVAKLQAFDAQAVAADPATLTPAPTPAAGETTPPAEAPPA